MNVDGIVLVDKPSGPTSHDVVGAIRKIFGTRKVGHAGTLDPMATGMLVIGVGRATRLLGYFTSSDKEYLATIRLGAATSTDDSQGEEISSANASLLADDDILHVIRQFRGSIQQRPSSVSAIKVDGKRAYAMVRAGEDVELQPREINIVDLEVLGITRLDPFVDIDVRVECSAGTYIRALARDIGQQLSVGGHLTMLRRTRSGVFTAMKSLDELREQPSILPMSDAVRLAFPSVELSVEQAQRARHGVRVSLPLDEDENTEPIGVFDESGEVISLARIESRTLVPLVVFVGQS